MKHTIKNETTLRIMIKRKQANKTKAWVFRKHSHKLTA